MRLDSEGAPALPQLNLYNFEEDEFVGSKYVLTSPRSLEACDMLSVKPMELIYKPLSEFQDEMLQRGLTFQDAYAAYDQYEKGRQRKLRECRDYRDKMIRDKVFSSDDLDLADGADLVADAYDAPLHVNGFTGYNSHTDAPFHVNGFTGYNPPTDAPLHVNGFTGYNPPTEVPYTSHFITKEFSPSARPGYSSPLADPIVKHSEGWRAHAPYAERHINKQPRDTAADRLQSRGQFDDKTWFQREEGAVEFEGHDRLTSAHVPAAEPLAAEPPICYKSQFMRRKLGQEVGGGDKTSLNGRREMASSLPLYADDAYKSAYTYHRRSYTTDGVGIGLARTSTPYDQSAAKAKALDRSFTSVSDIYPNSPREEPVTQIRPAIPRRRTNSAHTHLQKEAATLRKINGCVRGSKYETRGEWNMSRSLSLTDLGQLAEVNTYHPRSSYDRLHHRGYTSDGEYTTKQRLKSERDDTDEILSRALERRQREIEEDLHREEVEYRHHVDRLQDHFTDMGIYGARQHQPEVNALADRLESDRWRHYDSRSVPVRDRYYAQPQRSTQRLSSSPAPHSGFPDFSTNSAYPDESLADRTQRERRVELARELAVQELETARVKSQQSRLQSERVRRAFREALSKNEKKWRRKDLVNGTVAKEEVGDSSYGHIEEVISEAGVRSFDGSNRRHVEGERQVRRSPLHYPRGAGARSEPERDSPRENYSRPYEEEERTVTNAQSALRDPGYTPHSLSPHDLETEDFRSLPSTPRVENGYQERLEVQGNAGVEQPIEKNSNRCVRRPRKPGHRSAAHEREPVRLKRADQGLVEDRVKELRATLEERRMKLNKKLKLTDLQTQELRAARLETERKERDRCQRRANRRILKNSSDNKKTATPPTNSVVKGRITEQVRKLKTTPHSRSTPHRDERDTFDKKVLKAELNNWVATGHRTQQQHTRSRSANRNLSQFSFA